MVHRVMFIPSIFYAYKSCVVLSVRWLLWPASCLLGSCTVPVYKQSYTLHNSKAYTEAKLAIF